MQMAMLMARDAGRSGEVPVGAVIVAPDGSILARASNRVERDNDPTAHAEMCAIRGACTRLGSRRLTGCELHVTLEPCAMCAGAISQARISRLYFGAYDPKAGAVENGIILFSQPTCHFRPDVYGGIHERECAALMREFFADLRHQPGHGK